MSDLPLELLLLIFDSASARTLISLSLCSHRIRILVFPLLYRHIIFKNNRELSQFSSRVISEANGENLIDVLRVADHVYHLEFGDSCDAEYEEDELELLASALQHMKALRGFTWSVLLPRDLAIFHLLSEACKNLHDLSLRLWEDFFSYAYRANVGSDDDYMKTLFGFRGLTRLEISANLMSVDNGNLPSSMVDMIRASPNLVSLDLSLETYGDPRPKWDIDTLFRSIDIAPTTLRLRKEAGLNLDAFSDSTESTPFRAFLLSCHDRITSLALPSPQEDFAHGPPSLNLPPGILPALREFEGTIYWCAQLSQLQVASKLESLTVLLEYPLFEDDMCDVFLGALRAFSSLKALDIFDGDTFLSAEELKVVVDNAPRLESLTFAFNRDDTVNSIGSQLSRLNLRHLRTSAADSDIFPAIISEEIVRTLAQYCAALLKFEYLGERNYGMWVVTILRKDGGLDLDVSHPMMAF